MYHHQEFKLKILTCKFQVLIEKGPTCILQTSAILLTIKTLYSQSISSTYMYQINRHEQNPKFWTEGFKDIIEQCLHVCKKLKNPCTQTNPRILNLYIATHMSISLYTHMFSSSHHNWKFKKNARYTIYINQIFQT